jgi:hypothetical protein
MSKIGMTHHFARPDRKRPFVQKYCGTWLITVYDADSKFRVEFGATLPEAHAIATQWAKEAA